jgi:predicted aspartyl protease
MLSSGMSDVRTSTQPESFRTLHRAWIICISALLVGSVPQSACTQQFSREKSITSDVRIPFEEADGHIFLKVRINNSGPVWFGLDTGATRSLIDLRYAESLRLKSESTRQIGGAGGYEEAVIFENVSINLPGADLDNQTLWGLDLSAISSAKGRQMAGILGYELFKRFVVDIDYIANRLSLHEPLAYEYRGSGQSIPLNVQPDGEIYVQARVQAPGGNPIEGAFVVDTGGGGNLLLARRFVEQHRIMESVGKTLPTRGGGVGGEIQLSMGRLKSLELGRFVITHPLTGFTKVGEVAAAGKAGNIGGGFLRRFRVIFDYSRKRMILEPNSRLTEADEFDMSGAALMSEPPAFDVIKVVRVRPDSPSAEAGLKPQDIIIAVDGQLATTLSLGQIRKMFRVEHECRLEVKRGGQIIEVKLKLRRLI